MTGWIFVTIAAFLLPDDDGGDFLSSWMMVRRYVFCYLVLQVWAFFFAPVSLSYWQFGNGIQTIVGGKYTCSIQFDDRWWGTNNELWRNEGKTIGSPHPKDDYAIHNEDMIASMSECGLMTDRGYCSIKQRRCPKLQWRSKGIQMEIAKDIRI